MKIVITDPRRIVVGNKMIRYIKFDKEQIARNIEKALLNRSIMAEKIEVI